jgi:hypothetical protein
METRAAARAASTALPPRLATATPASAEIWEPEEILTRDIARMLEMFFSQ